jgi:hypothetical protein
LQIRTGHLGRPRKIKKRKKMEIIEESDLSDDFSNEDPENELYQWIDDSVVIQEVVLNENDIIDKKKQRKRKPSEKFVLWRNSNKLMNYYEKEDLNIEEKTDFNKKKKGEWKMTMMKILF